MRVSQDEFRDLLKRGGKKRKSNCAGGQPTSPLHRQFLFAIKQFIPEPLNDFAFHPSRNWMFDCAWPDAKVAVELHGAVTARSASKRGAHSRPTGQLRDFEKQNEAIRLGWVVLVFTAVDVYEKTGPMIDLVHEVLDERQRMAKATNYPIGATWRAVGFQGSIGQVFLSDRSDGVETWCWSFCYKDGSGLQHDWQPTKRGCIDECSVKFGAEQRTQFKRVKELTQS